MNKNSKEIFNDYFFSHLSSFFFIIGITVYVYFMIIEYKECLENNNQPVPVENGESKNMWRWTFLIMLLSGFFISSYCFYK